MGGCNTYGLQSSASAAKERERLCRDWAPSISHPCAFRCVVLELFPAQNPSALQSGQFASSTRLRFTTRLERQGPREPLFQATQNSYKGATHPSDPTWEGPRVGRSVPFHEVSRVSSFPSVAPGSPPVARSPTHNAAFALFSRGG